MPEPRELHRRVSFIGKVPNNDPAGTTSCAAQEETGPPIGPATSESGDELRQADVLHHAPWPLSAGTRPDDVDVAV